MGFGLDFGVGDDGFWEGVSWDVLFTVWGDGLT
jgi:hypothetical protein